MSPISDESCSASRTGGNLPRTLTYVETMHVRRRDDAAWCALGQHVPSCNDLSSWRGGMAIGPLRTSGRVGSYRRGALEARRKAGVGWGQFSYPLPFRGQVCKAQSPLPCFPSTVLSSRHPPSLDRVPLSAVPRRHQHYEGATTSHPRIPGRLFGSLPGPHVSSTVRVRLAALPRLGPGSLFSRRSILPG